MKPQLIFVAILALFLHSAQGAELSSLSDCRTHGWDDSRLTRSDSFRILRDQNKECFGHFHLSPRDSLIQNGRRAELRDPSVHPAGSRVVYRFQFFISKASQGAAKRLVLAQWHDWKDKAGNVKRPPLSMRLAGSKIVFPLFNDSIYTADPEGYGKSLAEVPASFDRWITMEITVRWKADASGSVAIKMNGKTVANYRGPVGYRSESSSPYMKFGLYTTHPLQKEADAGFRRVSKTLIKPTTQRDTNDR
jgi:hypothetical protein